MIKSSLKKTQKPLKKTQLKKINPLTAKKKQIERKQLHEEDKVFYDTLWANKAHFCELSGQRLGNEINICFFHHLLPKEHYPEYRHCDWNILFITRELHSQIETNPYHLPEKEYDRFIGILARAKYKAGLLD